MGSSVQSHDEADACAHGLQIGAFNIDIDQQLSDPVSQKDFPLYTFPTSLLLLGLPKRCDRCWARCWGVFPYPPSHSWAPCTGREGWDFQYNTPAKHLHSSQLWLNTQWSSSKCCSQGEVSSICYVGGREDRKLLTIVTMLLLQHILFTHLYP